MTDSELVQDLVQQVNSVMDEITHDPDTGEFWQGEELLPFSFFPKKREFHTSTGEIIRFRPVTMNSIFMFKRRFEGKYKPKMPTKPIEYDEGEFYLESNPRDARYMAELEDFDEKLGLAVLQFIVNGSVLNKVPSQEEWSPYFEALIESMGGLDSLDKTELKYLWVTSLFSSDIESNLFSMICQGQKVPTKEAIETAEARFPSNGK